VALALAAWVRYMTGLDENGKEVKLEDPMAAALQPLARAAAKPSGSFSALEQFLALALGETAASWPQLSTSVARWLTALCTRGANCALAEALAESSSLAAAPLTGHGGGADLATTVGHTAHGRLAVLRLRRARLQAELKEVGVQLVLAGVEAEAEEEEMAKALEAGMRRPRSLSHLAHQKLSSPPSEGRLRGFVSCGGELSMLGHHTPVMPQTGSATGLASLHRQLSP